MANQCFVVRVNRIGADGFNTAHSDDTNFIDFSNENIMSTADNQYLIISSQLEFSKLEQCTDNFQQF